MKLDERKKECEEKIEVLKNELKDIENKIKNEKVEVYNFVAQKQNDSGSHFILGLLNPSYEIGGRSYGLPSGYEGRGAFTAGDLSAIAHGLLRMIGEE